MERLVNRHDYIRRLIKSLSQCQSLRFRVFTSFISAYASYTLPRRHLSFISPHEYMQCVKHNVLEICMVVKASQSAASILLRVGGQCMNSKCSERSGQPGNALPAPRKWVHSLLPLFHLSYSGARLEREASAAAEGVAASAASTAATTAVHHVEELQSS